MIQVVEHLPSKHEVLNSNPHKKEEEEKKENHKLWAKITNSCTNLIQTLT
jgi:hypothetical protein